MDHKDSLGNAGTIYTGDVQWMARAAASCTEMPQQNDRMEGFQLWVNLPAALKMCPPLPGITGT